MDRCSLDINFCCSILLLMQLLLPLCVHIQSCLFCSCFHGLMKTAEVSHLRFSIIITFAHSSKTGHQSKWPAFPCFIQKFLRWGSRISLKFLQGWYLDKIVCSKNHWFLNIILYHTEHYSSQRVADRYIHYWNSYKLHF